MDLIKHTQKQIYFNNIEIGPTNVEDGAGLDLNNI